VDIAGVQVGTEWTMVLCGT